MGIIYLSEFGVDNSLLLQVYILVENDIKLRRSRFKLGVNLFFVVGIFIICIDFEKIKFCIKIVNK